MPTDPPANTIEGDDAARRRRGRTTQETPDQFNRRTRDIYSEVDRLGWRQEDFKEDIRSFEKGMAHVAADVETVKNGLRDLRTDFTDMHRRLFGFGPLEPGALGRIEEQVRSSASEFKGRTAVTVLKWAAGVATIVLAAIILAYFFHIGK